MTVRTCLPSTASCVQHVKAWLLSPASPLHGQVLAVNNERVTVPEVVFAPSDIGARQAGLAQARAVLSEPASQWRVA